MRCTWACLLHVYTLLLPVADLLLCYSKQLLACINLSSQRLSGVHAVGA